MNITKRQLRRIIKEEKVKLQEASPEYPKHMFPDRDSGPWAEETVEAAALELNQILNVWNNNPHLDPDAMRALPKHVSASLDDLFVRVEDVMLKLRGEKV
jgi:hypothetical protein